MLALAILLFLQSGSIGDQITFRLVGKVFVGESEPAMVDVILKDAQGNVIETKQSFANGSFWFDNLTFGYYSVAVHNPKYRLIEFPVIMREARDTARTVVINLEPLGGAPPPPLGPVDITGLPSASKADIEALKKINFDELALDNPADAVEEFRLGVEAVQNWKKANPSEEHFKKAIAIAPEFYDAHLQLGIEQKRQGKTADAIATLQKALAVNESGARAISVLGVIYLEKQQFQNAADMLMKLGPLGPLTAEDRFALGFAFYRLDRLAAAAQQLATAIELAPGKMPQAYLMLHNVFMKGRNPVAGLAILDDYLRVFPQARDSREMSERAKRIREMLNKK